MAFSLPNGFQIPPGTSEAAFLQMLQNGLASGLQFGPGGFSAPSEQPPAALPPSFFARHCDRPGCNQSLALRCSACRAASYCSKQCASAAWPAHRATCSRLASDVAAHGPSPLLDALEISFWGRLSGLESPCKRLKKLQAWLHPAGTRHAPLASLSSFLSVVSLPPCVTLPGGRFAAFIPGFLLGVYTSKQEALRAALDSGAFDPADAAAAAPAPGRELAFGPHGRGFPSCVARVATLKFEERAVTALAVARHHKPLREGAEVTSAEYYRGLRPRTLPHPLRMQRPDILLLVAKGGGELKGARELALGRYSAD